MSLGRRIPANRERQYNDTEAITRGILGWGVSSYRTQDHRSDQVLSCRICENIVRSENHRGIDTVGGSIGCQRLAC